MLGANGYTCAQYVRSAENVADDPARERVCRDPESEWPQLLVAASEADYRGLDDFLAAHELSDAQVAQLPKVAAQNNKTEEDFDIAGQEDILQEAATEVSQLTTPAASHLGFDKKDHWAKRPFQRSRSKATGETNVVTSPAVDPPRSPADREPWITLPELTDEAISLLKSLPADQFVTPQGFSLQDCISKQGHLDLFSGSRGLARQLAECTGRFVLTFVMKHSSAENLLDPEVQDLILRLVRLGCFATMTAGPVCSSFSRAVRPAVRSALHCSTLRGISANTKLKVAEGNRFSDWMARLTGACVEEHMIVLVENPALSYLWWMPEWVAMLAELSMGFFTAGYCRWGTRWRKRTRFLTNAGIANQRCLCTCSGEHIQLKGYSRTHGTGWTRVAEPYPRQLFRFLAAALTESLKPEGRQFSLDIVNCSKTGRSFKPRAATETSSGVRDVGGGTDAAGIYIGGSETCAFKLPHTAQRKVVGGGICQHYKVASLQVHFLRSFGSHMCTAGEPMYFFRRLVVWYRQNFLQQRADLITAWELLNRWETAQPLRHRTPMPKLFLDAFLTLSLRWGWLRFAALTAVAFHGAMRIGEPLQALRSDLILPAEAALEQKNHVHTDFKT